jgi:5-methylcytosine-specific restriction endonuclease McrA
VIKLFQEISDRRLYLDRGFPTLFEMVTKQFGYCAGSAMRRINSMRLLREIPSIESKTESGELTLTVVSDVQSFFHSEAKESRPYSLNAKIELIETCTNKSKREVESELCRRNPEREKRESIRQISEDRLRMSLSISGALNEQLNHLRDLLSHAHPNMSMEELIENLAELGLEKYDPARKARRAFARKETLHPKKASRCSAGTHAGSRVHRSSLPPAETGDRRPVSQVQESRSIRATARHDLAARENDVACTFVDPVTKRRCGSTRFIEIDHIEPYSYGGSNESQNLQYTCSAHNKLRWAQRSGSQVKATQATYG